MSKKIDAVILDFLCDVITPRTLAAYNTVARLSYPIADHHSFSTQIEGLSQSTRKDDDAAALKLVAAAFDVSDFPIQTPRGGLEKFHARFVAVYGDPYLRPLPPRLTVVDPGFFYQFIDQPDVDVYSDYYNLFGRNADCARCATNHYEAGLRLGEHPVTAFWRGRQAGRQCQRTGTCPPVPRTGP